MYKAKRKLFGACLRQDAVSAKGVAVHPELFTLTPMGLTGKAKRMGSRTQEISGAIYSLQYTN